MEINEHDLYAHIGHIFREHRKRLEYTQEEIGTVVGLTRTSINNIESGIQKTPLHVLYQACRVFGIEITEMLPTVNAVVRGDPLLPEDPVQRRVRRRIAELENELAKLKGNGAKE